VPRYLVERRFNVTEDAMPAIGRKSREVLRDEVKSVTWELSHVVVGDDGLVTTFCVYDAPGEDAVMQHATLLGEHHIASLHEIAADVTPEDFPLHEPAD
jgi:Protein of unknown function (DUF4242)